MPNDVEMGVAQPLRADRIDIVEEHRPYRAERREFYAVNVACLDDATVAELANAPIVHEDGKHDGYGHPSAETVYLSLAGRRS